MRKRDIEWESVNDFPNEQTWVVNGCWRERERGKKGKRKENKWIENNWVLFTIKRIECKSQSNALIISRQRWQKMICGFQGVVREWMEDFFLWETWMVRVFQREREKEERQRLTLKVQIFGKCNKNDANEQLHYILSRPDSCLTIIWVEEKKERKWEVRRRLERKRDKGREKGEEMRTSESCFEWQKWWWRVWCFPCLNIYFNDWFTFSMLPSCFSSSSSFFSSSSH